MNRPIHDAIQTLQNTITEFSSSLLQANLVDSKSTIRTIRASSTLEDAQIAWARPLNLPGSSRGGDGSIGAGDLGEAGTKEKGVVKREGESDLGRMMRRGWRGGVFPGEKGTEKERSPPEMPETGAATVVEITFDTAPAAAPVPVPANSATPKLNQVKTEAQAQGEEGQKVKRSPPRSRVDPQRLHFTHAELWGNSVQRRRIQDDQQDQETRSPTVLVPGADGVEEKEEFEKGENGMIFDGIHGPLVKGRIKVRPFLGD